MKLTYLYILIFMLWACHPSDEKKAYLETFRFKDEQFDQLIEKQFLSEKNCQLIFTGNKGNYSSAKLSYAKIFAHSFLQDICSKDVPGSVLDLFQQPPMGSKDALSLGQFNHGTRKVKSLDNQVATYALIYSLGQRESNGNFNEGRDLTANNTQALTEEAGLVQVSANSLNLKGKTEHTKLFLRRLFQDYVIKLSKMSDQGREDFCLIKVLGNDHESKNFDTSGKRLQNLFQEGECSNVSSTLKDINFSLTDNIALCFRNLTKECPSFAIKYGGGVARIRRDHNGPLKLHEEFGESVDQKYLKPYLEPACHNLFKSIVREKDKLCVSSNLKD
jgi:hypothetical protein